ncbi:hypothetical protein BW685_28025 [Burkholderia ubonensis]|uniref:Uncharacterized protein n=2 Tax=Burkholderia ubonensis TaxID=101571 RepID=A0A1R1J451_9BURK|nr:hypothetical protein BW685_28025 [Burkholderia ubonensis]
MNMMRWRRSSFTLLAGASALGLLAGPAWADGSVSFSADIRPLIKARPAFEKFIDETFDITDTGWGTRIGNEAMPHLGGARMGPYEFQAIWHGGAGNVPVTLVIDTDIKFLDGKGQEITDGQLENAFSLKETFSSIEIEPPKN